MKTVVFSQAIHPGAMEAIGKVANVVVANSKVTAEYLDKLKDANGVVLRMGLFGKDIIDACPNLEVIARPGVGVDTIDLAAATARGIPVVIAPGGNVRAVAEHTVGMLYAITKNIVENRAEILKGNYDIRNKGTMVELKGRRIGVAGFGAIGKETSRLMKANEMEVLVYDPFVKSEVVKGMGCTPAGSFEELISTVDFLTLHMPAAPETRGLLGEKQFAMMKKGIFIINCARGDLINEDALFNAMKEGIVAGAAVDVMVDEPMDPRHKLFTLPNFIATAHSAAQTRESFEGVGKMVADGVCAVLSGRRWDKVFNPEAYNHPKWKK